MKRTGSRIALFGVLAAGITLVPVMSHAQQEQPPPPPPGFGGPGGGPGRFGGPGGPGGFRGPGGFGRPGANQRLTVANVPVALLEQPLRLTSTQKQQIQQVQDQLRADRQALMPGRGGFGGPGGPGGPNGQGGPGVRPGQGGPAGGGPGGRPDFQAIQQQMERKEQQAEIKIHGLLTAEQRKALPDVLRDLQTLIQAGLPPELLAPLNLTVEQKSRLFQLNQQNQQAMQKRQDEMRQRFEAARRNGGERPDFQAVREEMDKARSQQQQQVMAVLTDAQRALVEKYRQQNPQPQGFPGGPGGGFRGPGGGPGGRPGGAPGQPPPGA